MTRVSKKKAEKVDIIRMDLPMEKIIPDSENPNEMDQGEFDLLVENIREVGFIDPITVIPLASGNYGIIGGEHRWRAAQAVGMREIPADVVQGERWKDEDLRHCQNVRMNVIHGKLNPEKMLQMYNKMAAKYGEKAIRLLGFASDTAFKKIVKVVKKDLRSSLPPEMANEFDKQAKEAKTINDLEHIIQHLFQEHGDSINHSYMVFTWGGKEHVYIAMSKDTHTSLKKIMNRARKDGLDINELIGTTLKEIADSIGEENVARA
jgi:hypothetical protein